MTTEQNQPYLYEPIDESIISQKEENEQRDSEDPRKSANQVSNSTKHKPKNFSNKFVFDSHYGYYKNNCDLSVFKAALKELKSCLDSFPQDQLHVSNSNLINQVLVKDNFLVTLTYEAGLSLYTMSKRGEAHLLEKEDSSLFMYLLVDICSDMKHIFSFKYNLAFEYSVFDKKTKKFEVKQDLGGLLTKGGRVNGVIDLKYCNNFKILAAVVRMEGAVSLYTFELREFDGDQKLRVIEKVPGSDFAKTFEWTSSGKHIIVGLDYEQDLGKKGTKAGPNKAPKPRLSLLETIAIGGRRASKLIPKTSIKAYRLDQVTKKMTLCFKFPPLPNQGFTNIKMIRLSGDAQIMISLTKTGVFALWKMKTSEKKTQTISTSEKEASQASSSENKLPIPEELNYELIKTSEVKNSPMTVIDLSYSGNLMAVVLKNGQVKTFIRNRAKEADEGYLKYDLLAKSYSEGSSIKHCYFTKDEKNLIYAVKSGVLKSEKIQDLKKRAQFVDSGQYIKYGENWKVNWLEFMNVDEYLMASIRDLRGSEEDYKGELMEKNENGIFKKILEFKGNPYKFGISRDGLLFVCLCYPPQLHKFVRKSKKHNFEKVDLDLRGKEPFAALVMPDSKDIAVSTDSKDILLFRYSKSKNTHKFVNCLKGDIGGFINFIRNLQGCRDLVFSSLDAKIRFAKEKTLNMLDYQIYKEISFDDVPSDFKVLDDNTMMIVALNSGMIVTMLVCPEKNNEFVITQQIKIVGLLGIWNDLRLQMFNNNRYFFIYQRGHHFFNPNAHTELLLFSINQKHVQKVDSYGLVEHFWASSNLGMIAIAEKEDPSVLKIIDLNQDFKIPQMKEVCERYYKVSFSEGSVQRTANLLKLYKSALNYFTDETRVRLQEKDQDELHCSYFNKENKPNNNEIINLDNIGKRMLTLKKNEYSPWNRFRDEAKAHSQFNFLLHGVVAQNIRFIKHVFMHHGYRPLLSPEGYDPIDMALFINDVDLLNGIAQGLQDSRNLAYFLARLDLGLFVKVMNCESAELKRVVVKACFVDPLPLGTHVNNSFPFKSKDESFLVFTTKGLTFTRDVRRKVDNVVRKRKGVTQSPAKAQIFRFLFDSSFTSESTYQLLQAYKGMPEDLKTGDYHRIIKFLWKTNYHFICFYSFFVILTTTLFHAYITWHPENFLLAVITLLNCVLLLFYEGVNYSSDPGEYFDSGYNYLDLFIYMARPAIIVLRLCGALGEADNELVKAWVNITLMVAGFRSMGELRVFSSTRVLMAMISQVVYDMVAFTIITIGMLVVFSLVSANINKFEPESSIGSLMSFVHLMNRYYNIAAGQWDESIENLNLSEVINFYISGIALFILMINLLIAVISLTFDEFLETKEFCDLEQLYDVMIDHCTFIGVVQKIWRRLFGVRKTSGVECMYHHCFMIQVDKEANTTEQRLENLDLKVEMLKQSVKINFSEVKSLIKKVGMLYGYEDDGYVSEDSADQSLQ